MERKEFIDDDKYLIVMVELDPQLDRGLREEMPQRNLKNLSRLSDKQIESLTKQTGMHFEGEDIGNNHERNNQFL